MRNSMRPIDERVWLRQQISAFERRLVELEAGADSAVPAPPERPLRAATAPPPPGLTPPPGTMPPPPGPMSPGAMSPGAMLPGPMPPAPLAPEAETARPPLTMPAAESLLKWSGLVLMFLSAVFLVSTAIQRGWIGPELQLAGAGAIGAALIAGGLVIGRRREGWDLPLAAAGVCVLSATATAGWQWLELGARQPWIVASFGVLAVSVWLTARLGGPGAAGTGLVATAMSLSFLAETAPEAAALVAGAVLVVEATSLWRRLTSLHLIAAVTGIVTLGVLAIGFAIDDRGSMIAMLIAGAIVTLAVWSMPMVMTIRAMAPSPLGAAWTPTADRLSISLPVLFATGWALASGLAAEEAGHRFLVVGALALVGAGLAMAVRRFALSVWVSQLMGGAAAVTVGSALVLDGPAFLVSLAVQAAALVVFVRFVPDRWASVQAGAMATIAGLGTLFGMLAAIDVNADVVDDVVHLGVVALLGAWAWWELRTAPEQRSGLGLAAATFVGLVIWPLSALIHVEQGQALISGFWAALGFATLIIGFARSSIRLTQLSLATLGVVMVKLLTIDLAAVDTFWRVALFFVLGGAFLFASFRLGSAVRRLAEPAEAPGPDVGDDSGGGQSSGLAFQK